MTRCFKLAAVFVLLSSIAFGQSPGKMRTYYIAADEVDWDYAPGGVNKMMGMKFDGYSKVFTERGPHRIGTVYRKAIYREYTDETFTHLKARSPEWEHAGILGPILRAEVGDTIEFSSRTTQAVPTACIRTVSSTTKTRRALLTMTELLEPDKEDDAVPPGQDSYLHMESSRARRSWPERS